MMGDGVIEIRKLRAAVEAEGFSGPCEVELFSNDWWSRPIDEVLSTMIDALSRGLLTAHYSRQLCSGS